MSKIILGFDIAGAEFVVLGFEALDKAIISDHKTGGDHHTTTIHKMTDVPREYVKAEAAAMQHNRDRATLEEYRKANLHMSPRYTPPTMTFRQAGKKNNFALGYGAGPGLLANEMEVGLPEANKSYSLWHFRAHPEVRAYHQYLKDTIAKTNRLSNCFGREVDFEVSCDIWGNVIEAVARKAYAFVPQSTVFDVTRIGLTNIYKSSTQAVRRFQLAGQVHDEIYGLIDADEALILDCVHEIALNLLRPVCHSTRTGEKYQLNCECKLGWCRGDMIEFKPDSPVEAIRAALQRPIK